MLMEARQAEITVQKRTEDKHWGHRDQVYEEAMPVGGVCDKAYHKGKQGGPGEGPGLSTWMALLALHSCVLLS